MRRRCQTWMNTTNQIFSVKDKIKNQLKKELDYEKKR